MLTTTTSLTSNSNPSTYGSGPIFTATVTPTQQGGPTMTGSIVFQDGNVALGSAPVFWNSMSGTGSATFNAPNGMLGGQHSITASYSGDGNYESSTSPAFTQTVNTRTPNLNLSSSPPSSSYGQPVTLIAQIGFPIPGIVPPTGTVTFFDGATILGTAPFVAMPPSPYSTLAQAVLNVSALSVANHSLSASYPGDRNYGSGNSNTASLTVSQAFSTTTLTSSANPSALCQSVMFTATVTPVHPGSGKPTGSVSFQQNGTTVATVNLTDGVAVYSPSALPQGSSTYTAIYNGDGNFSSSTSNAVNQTVNPAVDWVLTANPAAADPQQAVVVPFGTAMVSPLDGGLRRGLAMDANQHAACDCGCGCSDDNCRAGAAPLGLTYLSNTLNVQPILLATLARDFCSAVPSSLQAQLTFHGVAQGWLTFGTSGHNPGDVYYLPLQVASPVSASGIYSWSVEVKATVGSNVYDRTVSGVLPVVVNAASSFGAGWALGGLPSLLIGSAGIALVDNGSGGSRFFTGSGPSYTSPANDQGTLVQNGDGSYTYTTKDQLKTNFDSSGRMTSQVDPHGLTQSLTYSGGLLSTITQPDGGITTFHYANGLLSSIQLPGNRTLTPTYTGSNLTGFTDAADGVYVFGYDSSNRLTSEQVGPLSITYSYSSSNGTLTQINRGLGTTLSVVAAAVQGLGSNTAINANQAVATLTDGLNHTTNYLLDGLGRPTQLQTPDGAVQSWQLNAAGNPTNYVDQLGRTTAYAYNPTQDLTQVTNPDGTSRSYQYEMTFHQVTQIQDELNNVTQFSYDTTTGDLLSMTDAMNNVTSYTWANGLKQTATDALTHTTTNQWDSTTRRLLSMTDALSNKTQYGYDTAGNRTSVQDALTHTTTFTFDGNRRQLTRTNALNGVQSSSYDAAGNLVSSTDELNRTTQYVYDQRGLPTSVTEAVNTPQQRTTTTVYDNAGNAQSVTDALNDVTQFAYDALNRPTSRTDAYGTSLQRTTSTAYDLAGNVASTVDALGVVTKFVYDVRNRLLQRIEAYGTSLQRTRGTTYDAAGNVLTMTDPLGTVTSYSYDALNRLTQQTDANNTSWQRSTTMAYDAVGNLTSVTNAVNAVTQYGYDNLNRRTQVIEAYNSSVQRTTTTAYDAVGNVSSVTDPNNVVTTFSYDALNRELQEVQASGTSVQRTLSMTYDAVGNLLPSGIY